MWRLFSICRHRIAFIPFSKNSMFHPKDPQFPQVCDIKYTALSSFIISISVIYQALYYLDDNFNLHLNFTRCSNFNWIKFALLWGEAQLCSPYIYLLIEKNCHSYPKATHSYPRVTYSDPKVTYSDPRVTQSDPTPLPLPPPTSPEPHLAIS